VFRALGSSGGTFSQVGTATANTFTDTGLTANTTYRYQIRARDAAGNVSAFSNTVTATTTGGTTAAACSATFAVVNSWAGAFQGQVTVLSTGTAPTNGWTVTLTFPGPVSPYQIWNATFTQSGTVIIIKNLSYNGVLAPGQSTSAGFLATVTGTLGTPTITCTSP
jgi:cellulase/cellobiase CelA1